MNLNILFVDDDDKLRGNLMKIFNNEEIGGHTLLASEAKTFEEGIEQITNNDYDIVILDLYKGKPEEGSEKLGLEVLKKIQSVAFMPVIFYSGLTKDLAGIESEIVGVVNKGHGGIDELRSEILRIINSNIALIKGKVYAHVKIALRDYFWNTVHGDKKVIEPIKNDVSIGYLLLRRLAHSLSKENIKLLLGDDKIKEGKAHPMEFYIYPIGTEEYEAGEILSKDKETYILLTPSCDYVLRYKKDGTSERKVGLVLLARVIPLIEFNQFKAYNKSANKDNVNKLLSLITNNQSDRFFFLPGTPFIKNGVIDFQNKIMVSYEDLKTFQRITKLDTPFAQSMASTFIRYYNRIGFPDVDSDYVIANLKAFNS